MSELKYVDAFPLSIVLDGCIVCNPTAEQCTAAGFALRTAEMRDAEALATEQAKAAEPFEISKIKLIEIFDGMGLRDTFLAFIASDEDLSVYWNNSTTLDSNHPKVVSAASAIGEAFSISDEQVNALLRSAQKG